ncbi:hypothetical protein VP1G_06755 [Cytospora mali]|uniref:Rhodopsin domain-containing protein n=1 Tax=Cytospora mali TaxID=578113 RepID=A0A194V6K8_CYTMA|nr:hypothetical protein VP1G_06755 [Valsa mali var. pyri (nom. inval.)]
MFTRTSRAESPPLVPPPGVSHDAFLAILWTMAGLSLIFLLFRLFSRFRGPRRLYWDDAFIMVAESMVLATVGVWKWAVDAMYYVLNTQSGLAVPGPRIYTDVRRYLNAQITVQILFYTTLLLVKLSFLSFFRRLGHNVSRQKYIWWPVLVFSVITYVVSIADIQFKCYSSPVDFVLTWCASAEANDFTMATMKANMALDVTSDFLIMVIPISLMWNVQMRFAKKMAFIGLFSLSIITIVIAIVRTTRVTTSRSSTGMDDSSFLWMWSGVQAPLAIIIACLAAFPQLFAASTKSKPVWTPTESYYQRLKTRMKAAKRSDPLYDLSAISIPGEPEDRHTIRYQVGSHPAQDNDKASYSSERPVLIPKASLHGQVTVCSSELSDPNVAPMQGQAIQRQLGYQVTQEEMPSFGHHGYGNQMIDGRMQRL